MDTSVYDSISRVAELEEKVYAQVQVKCPQACPFLQHTRQVGMHFTHTCITFVSQKANEFYNAMGKSTYNIEEGLPDLVDYAKTFMGLYKLHLDLFFPMSNML